MIDIVFNSKTYDVLINEARRLGFCEKNENNEDVIVVNGQMENGGNWFLNVIGDIYNNGEKINGFWGRLRLNGDTSSLKNFSSEIDQYVFSKEKYEWLNINTGEKASDFVQFVGIIS